MHATTTATPATTSLPRAATPVTTSPPRADAAVRSDGSVRGAPRVVLRVEAGAILVAALVAYALAGGSWAWFAALFLVPDLSMLGYLAGPRVGAAAYDAGHSLLGPALLGGAALALHGHAALLAAMIWVAHVGFDRLLGYGLKYGTAFGDTHLGVVGRGRRVTP